MNTLKVVGEIVGNSIKRLLVKMRSPLLNVSLRFLVCMAAFGLG